MMLLLKGQYPPVEVKEAAPDKGFGVFAIVDIKPFTIITEYIGDVMTQHDIVLILQSI